MATADNPSREDIVASARELDDHFDEVAEQLGGPGAFEGIADPALALAINTIGMHGFADQDEGTVEYGRALYRVGRFVLATDDRGFHWLEEHGSPEEAEADVQKEADEQSAGEDEEEGI